MVTSRLGKCKIICMPASSSDYLANLIPKTKSIERYLKKGIQVEKPIQDLKIRHYLHTKWKDVLAILQESS